MTPKEKAQQLVDKFYIEEIRYYENRTTAKQCALITVDEIIKRTRSVNTMPPNCQTIDDNTKEYWKQVQQQIHMI